MTPQEAAAALDLNEYGKEVAKDFELIMKGAGLVAVFGGSDDLMEFRGAIHDEAGAPGIVYLTSAGLLQNDCDNEDCPHFAKIKERAATITSFFGRGDLTFDYETEIPHATFRIMEDGSGYCEGIVFALADVVTKA